MWSSLATEPYFPHGMDCLFQSTYTVHYRLHITDHGCQFESQLWNNVMTLDLLSSKHARTTVYHHQTNGMVESVHWQLNATWRPNCNPLQTNKSHLTHLWWFVHSASYTCSFITNIISMTNIPTLHLTQALHLHMPYISPTTKTFSITHCSHSMSITPTII